MIGLSGENTVSTIFIADKLADKPELVEFAKEKLREQFPCATILYGPDNGIDLEAAKREADVLIVRSNTTVDVEYIRPFKKLKAVGRFGSGMDNIKEDALRA